MKKTSLPLYLLALLTATGIAWAYHTPIDVTIQATGIARPDGEVVRVIPDVAGRITTVHLREGQAVREGDVLLQLNAADLQLKQRALESRIHATEIRVEQLRSNLRETTEVEQRTLALDQSQDAASRRLSELALAESRTAFVQSDRLFEEGLISRQSHEGARASLERAQADLAKWAPDKSGVKAAQSEARLHERELEIESVRVELRSLYHQLEQAHLDTTRLTITSPADGQVSSAASLHPGENLAPGTVIAVILPANQDLIVESWIPAGERAEVREGQTVRLETESTMRSFSAAVVSISPDARVTESVAAYRVTIKPEGPPWIRPGMTFRTHFITKQERLLNLLFYRLRKAFET